jgi:GTPase KRas protein
MHPSILFFCSPLCVYRLIFRTSIREGEGFLLVYSITARATFERIERFRSQITRVKDSEAIPIVLVGNKSDKRDEREVGKEEGQLLARRLGCEFGTFFSDPP